MGEFERESDGRRIFTRDFKRATVERIQSGAATLAEVSRELEIAPSVLRSWIRLVERGSKTAVEAGEEVVALSRVKELEKQVQLLVQKAARKAGLANDSVHVLKHTFCSHLAMRGATPRAIQELAGRKDLSTSQGYMHLSPAAVDSAIALLDGDGARESVEK